MPEALSNLVVLACPVGMGLMMWLMMRGGKHSGNAAQGQELQELRAEVARLRADRGHDQTPDAPIAPALSDQR